MTCICTYDNPHNGCREHWRDGKLLHSITAHALVTGDPFVLRAHRIPSYPWQPGAMHGAIQAIGATVPVGTKDQKMVTPLNNQLFKFARELLEGELGDGTNMGWVEISELIDKLEQSYHISPKE